MTDTAIERWIAGAFLAEDQAMRGQIVELFELENLPFEAIEGFYKTDEEMNAAEDNQTA